MSNAGIAKPETANEITHVVLNLELSVSTLCYLVTCFPLSRFQRPRRRKSSSSPASVVSTNRPIVAECWCQVPRRHLPATININNGRGARSCSKLDTFRYTIDIQAKRIKVKSGTFYSAAYMRDLWPEALYSLGSGS